MSTAGRPFGKFTLIEKIGSGGMAEIWKASLQGVDDFEKQVVIKKILPRYAGNKSFIKMFVQEAKVCSLLHHSNVVQIFELGEHQSEYFIAMEYVKGKDLLALLTQCTHSNTLIPTNIGLHIVAELCKALAYAHTAVDIKGKALNIIHLDVSPANILLGFDGAVKLTDFGVARATIEGTPIGADDRLKGKLGYMSPEQVTGKPIDRRSDLFSVGIILYELLSLKRLFLGKSDLQTLSNIRDANIDQRLLKHRDKIPPGVADIIRRCLSRNADTRFQDAQEIEEAISRYLFDERIRTTPQMLSKFMTEVFGHSKESTESIPDNQGADGSFEEPASPQLQKETTRVSVRGRSQNIQRAQFRLKSPDGDIFGPVSYANFQNLLRTRSVSPEELVSIDGSDWSPVQDVSAIRRVLPDEFNIDNSAPADGGQFSSNNAIKVLSRIVVERRTGRLKLSSGTRLKEVYYRRGKPVHITSNSKNELLGMLLRDQGVVDDKQLADAIVKVQEDGGPLGNALVNLGHLNQVQLFRLLELQFHEKYLNLLSWTDSDYQFFEGEEPAPEIVAFSIDAINGLTEGVRRYISDEQLERYFSLRGNQIIRPALEPPFGSALLKFNGREYRFKNLVEGKPSSLSILLKNHASRRDDRRNLLTVLFIMHQTGHLRLD